MIVVDTNIIAHMTFATRNSSAVSLLHQRDSVWEAPSLWKNEFLNVLSLCYRKGLINYGESLDALNFAERLIGFREHNVPAKSIIEAVVGSGCSAYDCEFAVLAEKLGTNLITYDKKLVQEFPAVAITPEDFLASHK